MQAPVSTRASPQSARAVSRRRACRAARVGWCRARKIAGKGQNDVDFAVHAVALDHPAAAGDACCDVTEREAHSEQCRHHQQPATTPHHRADRMQGPRQQECTPIYIYILQQNLSCAHLVPRHWALIMKWKSGTSSPERRERMPQHVGRGQTQRVPTAESNCQPPPFITLQRKRRFPTNPKTPQGGKH